MLNLALGTIHIPFRDVWGILLGRNDASQLIWENIVWKSRFPQTVTALVAGAGLSISGLQMQTVFRNPLAGPSELGVSSGASLGVATIILLSGTIGGAALSRMGFVGEVAITVSAIVGAMAVMAIILTISQRVRGNVVLLILGVMIGYIATAIIGVLKFFSNDEDVRSYVIWGLGSFSKVSGNQVYTFVVAMVVLIPLSFLLIKTLNLMLLGDNYARNLGLNVKRARFAVIACSCVLTAIVTAYCGPIVFLGLAVPHLCRTLFTTSNHIVLMPAVTLTGAALALFCNLVARMPGFEGALPINSVTALIGAPIVISVLFGKRRSELN
ncbi:MAG: iron ABC transporter permease [Bacteroidales bacterium]|nr:iron ABC transporter permease [Bacteroidales bacterium]MBN2750981.1 iron ABC transporter permease [Bacteroidales bacterium]